MPRQRRESEIVIEVLLDASVRIDEIDEAGLCERQNTFAKGGACRGAAFPTAIIVQSVLEVLAIEQVAGIGKSWREAAVSLDHVPTDMIDMQMGAKDEIDFLGRNAGALQLSEVATGQPVKG